MVWKRHDGRGRFTRVRTHTRARSFALRALGLVLGVRTGAAYTSAVEGAAVMRRRESRPSLVTGAELGNSLTDVSAHDPHVQITRGKVLQKALTRAVSDHSDQSRWTNDKRPRAEV